MQPLDGESGLDMVRVGEFRVEGMDIHLELILLLMSKETECCQHVVDRLKKWVGYVGKEEREATNDKQKQDSFMDGLVAVMESLRIEDDV